MSSPPPNPSGTSPKPSEKKIAPRPSTSKASSRAPKPSTSKSSSSSAPVSKLKEFMSKSRKASKQSIGKSTHDQLDDPYANCVPEKLPPRKNTGLYFSANDHYCLWDTDHPENPERFTCIVERLKALGLDEKCEVRYYQGRTTTISDSLVLAKHNYLHLENLRVTCKMPTHRMESECSLFDSIYINENTFENAMLAVETVYDLAKKVATNQLQNGMAVVRPPGHHAMKNAFNGYCFLNNVGIAAQNLIDEDLAKKILILDYDVHHGQGIQSMFNNRKDVLYFSIHRYENGTFWPNLKEGDSSYIGEDDGEGYNINVPLNEVGCDDTDYFAIVFNLLLPIAYEFSPDIILIAGGYDAAIGCPEGEMRLTPGFYGQLITLLSGLANGKIVVALEGGYYLPSLAEGVAMTVKALLGEVCGPLAITNLFKPSITQTINTCKYHLKKYWKCFDINEFFQYPKDPQHFFVESLLELDLYQDFLPRYIYEGKVDTGPFPTKGAYPSCKAGQREYLSATIRAICKNYERKVVLNTGYVCDDEVLLHKQEEATLENPERILRIREELSQFKLLTRMVELMPKIITIADLYGVHDEEYLRNTLINLDIPDSNDLYVNEHTITSVLSAVGGPMALIDAIVREQIVNGIAIVRPPGHHAQYNQAEGFCFVNNVVVAAKYAIQKHNFERVLIVDFDVHHGNGTQELTYNRKDIMYISIHRYDNGQFFPKDNQADYSHVGNGSGEGYNINIPLTGSKLGNAEYLMAFTNIILPIAYTYNPDLVLVSAGFDAGIYDTLGGYNVYPEMFGHFIQWLKPLAQGKLVLTLEGGYQLTTLSHSVMICVKTLLGDPIPTPTLRYPVNSEAITIFRYAIPTFQNYWHMLKHHKRIGDILLTDVMKDIIDNLFSDYRRQDGSRPAQKRDKILKAVERLNRLKLPTSPTEVIEKEDAQIQLVAKPSVVKK